MVDVAALSKRWAEIRDDPVARDILAAEQTKRVRTARKMLLLEHPYFGAPALRMTLEATYALPTAATDGTRMVVNPVFVESLPLPQIMAITAHETLHNMMGHTWRLSDHSPEDHAEWNICADYAINPILASAGLEMPADSLNDPEFAGMSAEHIFKIRSTQRAQNKPVTGVDPGSDQSGQTVMLPPQAGGNEKTQNPGTPGESDGSSQSDNDEPGDETPKQLTEADWRIAAEQAANAARKAGRLPGELDIALKAEHVTQTNWRDELREFAAAIFPSDYSWRHPDRRFVAGGMYLAGIVRDGTCGLACAVDLSGSTDGPMRQTFADELTTVLSEVSPEYLDVACFDTAIRGDIQRYEPGDVVEITVKAGGGTDFRPVFRTFTERDEQPAALIMLTDGEATIPPEPDFPVLWAIPITCRVDHLPYGRVIRIDL